jgi:hypothetical protein
VRRSLLVGAGVLAVPLAVAGCTGSPSTPSASSSTTATSPSVATPGAGSGATTAGTPTVAGAAGAAIPGRTTAPPAASTSGPEAGPPTVVAFNAPTTFRCLTGGKQGQVTLGWNVPDATAVDVQLDGSRPAVGIQDALPYQVPAGKPVGVGSTVVFDCGAAAEHTLTVRWSAGADTNVTERSVTVRKESS